MNEMYNGQQDMNRQDEQPWSAVETKQNKTKQKLFHAENR